jgi:hypothetical protein
MSSNQDYQGGYGQQPYAPPQHQAYAGEYYQANYGNSIDRMAQTEAHFNGNSSSTST